MPDPLGTRAFADYLERERGRCRAVLQRGSGDGKLAVLMGVQRMLRSPDVSRTRLLPIAVENVDLIVPLLTDESRRVRAVMRMILEHEQLALTAGQLEAWAAGDWECAKAAIAYAQRNPRPEYGRAVEQVFGAGRHLHEDSLFAAIIATNATGCADDLRACLEREHINLRRNAAVALAHFGDAAGLPVLEQEWRRVMGDRHSSQRRAVHEALIRLGRPPLNAD
jgi:HEAT repeat protein